MLAPRWGIGYAQTAFIRPRNAAFRTSRRPRLEEDLREGRLSKDPETVAPKRFVSGARSQERAPSPALSTNVGLVKDNI